MATKNRIVEGYALLFNVEYPMGSYTESIAPQALSFTDMTDVRLLRDHISNLLLARNASSTLKLMVDKTGLFFRATLPDSALGNETADLLERRDLSQCSFGFMLEDSGSVWTNGPNGVPRRTIVAINKVLDVSLVTYPASPMTKAWISDVRSEGRNSVPEIESYDTILHHIEKSQNMELKSANYRAGSKTESSNAPFYECASHQVNNEARALVLKKAREIATGKKDDPAPEKDWRADLAQKQAYIAELKARHDKEYQEAGERHTKDHEAALEREAAKKRPISNEQQAYINARMSHLAERERQQRTPKIITEW